GRVDGVPRDRGCGALMTGFSYGRFNPLYYIFKCQRLGARNGWSLFLGALRSYSPAGLHAKTRRGSAIGVRKLRVGRDAGADARFGPPDDARDLAVLRPRHP